MNLTQKVAIVTGSNTGIGFETALNLYQNGVKVYVLIEKAKIRLSTTSLSVSEIAYGLGFEHPQSFSKLFKSKTSQTPLAFRSTFS